MTIRRIDFDKREATLTLSTHEIKLLYNSLLRQAQGEAFSEDDDFFLSEIRGVNGILHDGNFTRFLSFELARERERATDNDGRSGEES